MIFLCVFVRENSNKIKKTLRLVENGLYYVRLRYQIIAYQRERVNSTLKLVKGTLRTTMTWLGTHEY